MMLLIRKVDYQDPQQAADLLLLLDLYARDPMGGGEPLSEKVYAELVERLSGFAGAHSWLGYWQGLPVVVVNAFSGFSTFRARPLLNIHDIAVHPQYRGRGFSKLILAEVEAFARQQGCCKLTLEVLSNNRVAQGAYRAMGFAGYELDPQAGQALFWQKEL